MSELQDLITRASEKTYGELLRILQKIEVEVSTEEIGKKVEVVLTDVSEKFPKRILGKIRSDTKSNGLVAVVAYALSANQNTIRARFSEALGS